MSTHVGFTGTQRGMTTQQIDMVQRLLEETRPKWAHHGDCIGADAQFDSLAKNAGVLVHGHPCTITSKRAWCWFDLEEEPAEALRRNKSIVAFSDFMIAAPGEFEEVLRSGTWATIRYARKSMTDLYIVYPDGELITEGSF